MWVRLAPNPDWVARDSVSGRSTGTFAVTPVQHDVDDTPSRPWLPPSWNLIRPFRGAAVPFTRGPRYGAALDGTGPY